MTDEPDPRVLAAAQAEAAKYVSIRWDDLTDDDRCLFLERARRHIATADTSDAARGIVRVPLEPTQEMRDAAYHPTLGPNNPICAAIWRAMCAAATGTSRPQEVTLPAGWLDKDIERAKKDVERWAGNPPDRPNARPDVSTEAVYGKDRLRPA